jgi:hypothetical protein
MTNICVSDPAGRREGWRGGGAGLSGDANELPPDCPGGKEGLINNKLEFPVVIKEMPL